MIYSFIYNNLRFTCIINELRIFIILFLNNKSKFTDTKKAARINFLGVRISDNIVLNNQRCNTMYDYMIYLLIRQVCDQ